MSNFYRSLTVMNNVCIPRKLGDDTPFDGQSLFVYGYDDKEDDTFDGYGWCSGAFFKGEFLSIASNIMYWSPAIYYLTPAGSIMQKQKGYNPEIAFIQMNLTYMAVKYPNPRIITLPECEEQEKYYRPLEIKEDTILDEYNPVYGEYTNISGWWHNKDVKNATHYLPDSRLEPPLLDMVFGKP